MDPSYLFYFLDQAGELGQVERSQHVDDVAACTEAAQRLDHQWTYLHVEVRDSLRQRICLIHKGKGDRSG